MTTKRLSLVLAHRNDNYMGNSNWRLEITLNFIADQLHALQQLQNVEILVVDWGSSHPLHEAITLTDSAKQIVRYVEVPIDMHEKVSRGSSFPISIALNVGIRRAVGEFIALTSGDVLWTSDILGSFLNIDTQKVRQSEALKQSLVFIPRKNIPWSVVSQSPGIAELTHYIAADGSRLEVEPLLPFYMGCAGALVMHRDLWIESQGNDERLVFWGFNDIDLNLRMRLKYSCTDYYQTHQMYVYHLEHYPSRNDAQSTPKKTNPHVFNPFTVNDENWGLAQYSFAEWPRRQELNTIVTSVEMGNSPAAYFRIMHFLNILLFMFSGHTKRHIFWSFSILRDYFTDLLPSKNT